MFDVHHHHIDPSVAPMLRAILDRFTAIENGIRGIMATEKQVQDALAKIDTATTAAAAGLTTIAATANTISNEIDELKIALTHAGVDQALVDQANALSDKAGAVADSVSSLVPALQAIASKGAANPVPVPVPAVDPTPAA